MTPLRRMERHYPQPSNACERTEEEIRLLAARLLEHPKTLLEMPLLLLPEPLFQTARERRHNIPIVQATLDQWLKQAKEDDQCLRIERRWIPYTEVHIPDTDAGRAFFRVANAFGQLPMAAGIVPRNQNQGYWLKTLHYFYQARGLLFAYKLLGVIPNPTSREGLFTQHLSSSNIHNLELITDIDIAEYKLIEQGETLIQQWAASHQIPYPFNSLLDLILEIEKQSFLEAWALGPNNKELEWPAIEKQQDRLATRIRLLKQMPWLDQKDNRKTRNKRGTYRRQEAEYLKFLENYGWYGYFILALRPHQAWKLADPWKMYTDLLTQGKAAYIDDFYWQGGQPYRAREPLGNDPSTKPRKTRSRQRVEGTTNLLGYILWCWT